MGTDIKFFVEGKLKIYPQDDPEKQQPIWIDANNWQLDPFELHPYGVAFKKMWKRVINNYDLYPNERNYILFGILAGIRKEEIIPVAEPRGLPEDVCFEIKDHEQKNGGFAHSWLSFKEIEEINWHRIPVKNEKEEIEYRDYSKECENFINHTIPCLWFRSLAFEDLRLIFWFD